MGMIPKKEVSQYPYIGMSVEEYYCFVENAARLVVEAGVLFHNYWCLKRCK